MYSNPPMHGAHIVYKILSVPKNYKRWTDELAAVSQRILTVRDLKKSFRIKNTPENWDHIVNQIGMFSYTGLSEKICETLIDKYHIYLLKNGRISLTGITTKNIKYLEQSIFNAIEENK
jgi:aspartate/tyrosine/aromatic aminotransferase